jgi:hypothetical protein
MPTTRDILNSIENRLRELKAEIHTLSAARTALDQRESAPPKPRRRSDPAPPEPLLRSEPAPPKPRQQRESSPPGARHRRTRRPAATVPAGKLEVLLSDSDGLTTSALAELANGNRHHVLALLRELEAAGQVRRSGQRRATRWHAITDEERIEARAAELAALSNAAA